MGIIEKARALRRAIDYAGAALPDETAAECAEIYREWDGNGHEYQAGDRVTYNQVLYKALQDHVSQSAWNPADAPSLFAEILPGQGGTEIGEWVQPGSTNGYMTGDRVIYEGTVYESLIDNNVWSPADYPAGWRLIEE